MMDRRARKIEQFLASATVRRGAEAPQTEEVRWSREELSGRLIELSGTGATASLTAAIGLVVDAQAQGEPVAWITLPDSSFYPPDVADSGVDLEALAVVRAPGSKEAARAAERLVRSGSFGLVALDLGERAEMSIAMQGRLVSLAQKHDTAIVCLTDKPTESPSLGSMVSLRAEAIREEVSGGQFRCKVKAIKDKRRGPGWSISEIVRGPDGLTEI